MNVAVEVGSRRVAFSKKTYELSLTRGYVSHWGMAQAVRELIQNALDSTSPFVYSFERTEDGRQVLNLTSEFTTLAPQTLLLGSTSKVGQKDAIGSFGEGYKIALLVLTRLGFDVEMRNGDVLWRPRFRFSRQFGEEMLVIDESDLPDRTNKGLTFVVNGLSDADETEIRMSCLQMQATVGQVHSTPFGDILLDHEKANERGGIHSGNLYVGGLFICGTDLKYAYNIRPEHIKLERDRQTVDTWDLKRVTRDMWFATERWDEIAKLIEAELPDLEYAEFTSPEMVKEACYRLFQAQHPGSVAAASQAELKKLVEQGMTKTVVIGSAYYANVTRSPSYVAQPTFVVKTPTERLEAWFGEAKFHMHDKVKRSFRELITESKGWTVK